MIDLIVKRDQRDFNMSMKKKLTPQQLANLTDDLLPEVDDTVNLGNNTKEFKDAYIDGVAYIDYADLTTAAISSSVITSADITKGTIDELWITDKAVKTGTYTALLTDTVIYVNTATAFTITLPAVATAEGKVYTFIKTDSAAEVLTLDGNASEKIDASVTYVAIDAQYDSATIICDGTQWYIISTKLA